jgi:YbbR domain-containing protein
MKRLLDILISAVIAAVLAVLLLLLVAEAMNSPLTTMKPTSARPAACWRAA